MQFLTKTGFDENGSFLKTANFDENCGFWSKTTVFGEKRGFQADLSSETAKKQQNTTLPTLPSTGQHQTLKSMDLSVK